MTTITLPQLSKIFPASKKEVLSNYVEPLMETFEMFDISTVARKSMFLAQVGHESGGLMVTKENLNYSQQGLRNTFGKYFKTDADAALYARKPEMIASRVYANRMGNGNEASKDGWTYRGRGLIQITGRNNYTALSVYLKKTLPETVEFLETPLGAVVSAGWFWNTNKLNDLADQTRFTDMTKRINGGFHGLEDRKNIWGRAKLALV